MNASKFKDEVNQPSISTYISVPKSPRTPRERRSRSQSLKRKSPPSGEKQKEKKQIIERMASSNISQESNNGKKPEKVYSLELLEFKNDMMECFRELLNPINNSIREILQVQKELKEELVDTKDVKLENEWLKCKITTVVQDNEKLTQRVVRLENKLLESSVMLYGIYEHPWETDEVRKEMIHDVISDTVLGRSYEERIKVARTMVIHSSRRTGKYNPLSSRPISMEFLYKEDAVYLLNN